MPDPGRAREETGLELVRGRLGSFGVIKGVAHQALPNFTLPGCLRRRPAFKRADTLSVSPQLA